VPSTDLNSDERNIGYEKGTRNLENPSLFVFRFPVRCSDMQDIEGLLVTHKRAELSDLEELCKPSAEELRDTLIEKGADEAYVLQTCNRAEFYVSGAGRDVLDDLANDIGVREGTEEYVGHTDSVHHLMRLAAGLESMVVGEDEIIGQMRDAYHDAAEDGALDGALETAVLKALHLGERARTETAINEGNASMGSAAVEAARKRLGSLDGIKVIVVGAGEMGELVAHSLADREAGYDDILVANRTYDTASRLADEIGGEPVRFGEISSHLEETDVIVTATGAPHLIFDGTDLRGHELVVLDLANPRDVGKDAGEAGGVELIDIDDISEIAGSSVEERRRAAEEVEAMIDDEMGVLEDKLKERKAKEMLSTIYERAEEIRQEETREALRKLDSGGRTLDDREREIVDDLTSSLVRQLLSTPTEALKNAAQSEDYETLRSASEIFRVEEEENAET
jgi:glutamyl-tRNA reductase